VIEDRLDDETLNVEALASALGMGRTTLYRRLEFLEGISPMALAWRVRLEHAARMLRAGVGNVSEVAYAVGFKSVAHFSRRFNETYGMSPTAYIAGKGV
jgi:AraC-like DNA-binding protein